MKTAAEKLRIVADWFDLYDDQRKLAGQKVEGRDVQADLRRIADKLENPGAIVDRILADLTDRRGLRQEWEQIDPDVQDEIKQAWIEIVKEEIA